MRVDPGILAGLLPSWGFGKDTKVADVGQGTNNQTLLLSHGNERFVLRINQSLSVTEVHAEHGLLRRLRHVGLPFQVPEPVPALDGTTVIETEAGPASVCRWIPGQCPDLGDARMLERYGRAAGLLDAALADVPVRDAVREWRRDPLRAPGVVGIDDIDDLCDDLRKAGIGGGQAALLSEAARQVAREWTALGTALPVQVIHGDLAGGNTLADPRTGEISALIDFEFSGVGYRVQDFVAALFNSGALEAREWLAHTSSFIRGYASGCSLHDAEIEALPGLMLARSVGSVLWRASRWRTGKARLDEVTDRFDRLATLSTRLATDRETIQGLMSSGASRLIG